MKDRKKENEDTPKPASKPPEPENAAADALFVHEELEKLKKKIFSLRESTTKNEERIEEIEIHLNLLTRFLTTLCVEKFGMRVGVMKRLIKRIEKEAIRESQISHLESLYELPNRSTKKGPPQPPRPKNDPWEDVS